MQITVRKAVAGDLDILLGFEQAIVEAERPFDETIKSGVVHYYDLEKLIDGPDAEVVVAEADTQVIGSGYALIKSSKDYLKHVQYTHLGFMYVVPEHRGQGVNGMIVDALKQWSLSRGVREMRLEVYRQNLGAIRAYERAGFMAHMLEMRIEV